MSEAIANSPTNQFGEGTVEIVRVFDVPRALVWQAWTDPKMMGQWFAPKHFSTPVCELDVRQGGQWRIIMRGPDGSEYPCGGVYREVIKLELLMFTNNAVDDEGKTLLEGLTTVTFAEQGGKTTMKVHTHAVGRAPVAAQMLAGMEMGWSQTIDKLAEVLKRAA